MAPIPDLRARWRAVAEGGGIHSSTATNPPTDSPIGQWLAALSLYIGSPTDDLVILAGFIMDRFDADRIDRCPGCGHAWGQHAPTQGGCTEKRSGEPRCPCRITAPSDERPKLRRPTGADNPGDFLAMAQEMYDRLRPLVDFVGTVDPDDLLNAVAAVAHGGTKVYVASAQHTDHGDRRILGVSTTHEGATSYIGAAWLRDRGELINPEVLVVELDDPSGKVVKQ